MLRRLCFLCAFTALAQEPVPVFRTGSQLVEMTVVVQNDKGKPVAGLTKDDFTLTDDGRPQTIAVFEAHDGPATRQASAPLPAGFFSNRLEHRGGAPSSATVLLIDMIHTPPGYWGRARPHLAKFLRQADPQLRLAIYVLGRSSLRVVQDFTADASILAKQLTDSPDGLPRGLSAEMLSFMTSIGNAAGARAAIAGSGSGADLVSAMIAASEAKETAVYGPMDALSVAEAFAIIAQRLSGVPGRKNLVWLSTGFPSIDPTGSINRVASAMDNAARALSNAGVAVYPVDARGIMALTDDLRISEPNRATFGRPQTQAVKFGTGPLPGTITMSELASRTGGRLYRGEEIDQAMPAVFEHARSFYTLAYYPSQVSLDGKFRTVRVRVRKSGLKVSHRLGYYASEEAPKEDQRKADLTSAVWSPVDGTAIGFDAALEHEAGTPADARRLVLVIDGDRISGRMDLLVVQKNGEGKQVEGTLDVFEAKAQGPRVTHRKDLRLRPDAAILRVVLRNSAGGLGSLSIPLGSSAK